MEYMRQMAATLHLFNHGATGRSTTRDLFSSRPAAAQAGNMTTARAILAGLVAAAQAQVQGLLAAMLSARA
jgi:hypothetical protein